MTDSQHLHFRSLLEPALREARLGLEQGNMPCGGAVFDGEGRLLGAGHNTALTDRDPLLHGETAAFRAAGFGLDGDKSGLTFVTTLSPCWYCAGLIRWFGFKRLVIGDSTTFQVAEGWLRDAGVEVVALNDPEAVALMGQYITAHPDEWQWPSVWIDTAIDEVSA